MMLRAFFVTLFSLTLFTSPISCHIGLMSATEAQAEAKEVPNPLKLNRGWWEYFTVAVEELPEQIEKFKNALEELISSKQEPEVLKLKEEVFLNLDIYLGKKERVAPSSVPATSLKSSYTVEELLSINKELFSEKSAAARVESRLEFEQMRLSWLLPGLDQLIDNYHQIEQSSYEKLLLGLRLISSRIEIAIVKSDMNYHEKLLAQKNKVIGAKQEEIKDAIKLVVYDKDNKQELLNEKARIDKELRASQRKLKELEKSQALLVQKSALKTMPYYKLHYKISSMTIYIQELHLRSTLLDIRLLTLQSQEISSSEVIEKVSSIEKELSFLKKSTTRWVKELDNDHLKIHQLALEENDKAKLEQDTLEIYLEIENAYKSIENIKMNLSGANLLVSLLQERAIAKQSILSSSGLRLQRYWDSFTETFTGHLSVALFHINDTPVSIKTFLKVIIVLFLAFLFSKYLRRGISDRILVGGRCSKGTRYIILRMVHYFILLVSLLIALQMIGIDLTNIAIIAGALGIGIGFGLQSMVNNIISGFTVLFNKYLKVGDIVELADHSFATVAAINLQFTHIRTFDGASHIIPNAEIFQRGLKNWTMKNSYRRLRIPFSVAYGTDKEFLKKVILEGVSKEEYVLTGLKNYHDPQLWFTKYGDSAMEFQVIAWVDLSVATPNGIAISSLLWAIDNVLREKNIEVPFPQREVRIKGEKV